MSQDTTCPVCQEYDNERLWAAEVRVRELEEALEVADHVLCAIPVAEDDMGTEALRSDAVNRVRAALVPVNEETAG